MVIEIIDEDESPQELERAVIDAAVEWYEIGGLFTTPDSLRDAVAALIDARKSSTLGIDS
jgi:hypothetical protein